MPWFSSLPCPFSNALMALGEIRDDLQDYILPRNMQDTIGAKINQVQELPLIKAFESRPLINVMPIVTVGIIMGNIYVAYAWVCLPVVGLTMTGGSSITFHVTFALALISYHNAVVTDPGGIPDSWKGEPSGKPLVAHEGADDFRPMERKRTTGNFRYCSRERKFKPDRAHYCKKMKKNILRMDHFCPWLSNCVGYYNHKFFVLFLFYTVLNSTLADTQLIHALATCTLTVGKKFMLSQGAFLMSIVSATLAPFLGFHCWLISKNMTTIEFCENKCKLVNGCRLSRFDKGLLHNIQCVMGKDWYKWLIPMGAPPSDGTKWEAIKDTSE